MELIRVDDSEFRAYGRVLEGYDVSEILKEMGNTQLPEGVDYVASVPELERTQAAKELADGIYGQMEIQIGYCNGHNRKLNALEYHRDSEVNIAVNDLVLLLGHQGLYPGIPGGHGRGVRRHDRGICADCPRCCGKRPLWASTAEIPVQRSWPSAR